MHTRAVQLPGPERARRIQAILGDLVRDRQALRASAEANGSLLEANRRSIVYWQAELTQALLAEHGRQTAA